MNQDAKSPVPVQQNRLVLLEGHHLAPSSHLFRLQAVEAYRQRQSPALLLKPASPSLLALFSCLGALIVSVVLGAFMFDIDIASTGRGVLRSPGGSQTLRARIAGQVAAVEVSAGQRVDEGQLLVRLLSPTLAAELSEAEERVAQAAQASERFKAQIEPLYGKRIALIRSKLALTGRQRAIGQEKLELLLDKQERYRKMVAEGVATLQAADDVSSELTDHVQATLNDSMGNVDAHLAINSLDLQILEQQERLQRDLEESRARLEALRIKQDLVQVVAPKSGYVESLSVRIGDVMVAEQPIGQLVQTLEDREIVAFFPETDIAFVKTGSNVRVALDQFPAGEYGYLDGSVTRVSRDRATPEELSQALGISDVHSGPVHRVEIKLQQSERFRRIAAALRSGGLVSVRCVLRQQRLAALLWAPIRRWVE